jgi:hypothetical protein
VQTAEDEAPGQETATASAAVDVPLVSLWPNDAALPFDTNQDSKVVAFRVESSSGRRYVTIESADGRLHHVLVDHPELVAYLPELCEFRLEMTHTDANAPILEDVIEVIITNAEPPQLDDEAIFAYKRCLQLLDLMPAQQHLAAAVEDEVYPADTEESANIVVVAAEPEPADAPTVDAVLATAADADTPAAPLVHEDDAGYCCGFVGWDVEATESEQRPVIVSNWVDTQSWHLRHLLLQEAKNHGLEEAARLAGVLYDHRGEIAEIDERLGKMTEPQFTSPRDVGMDETGFKQQFANGNQGRYTSCTECERYYTHQCFARTHPRGVCPGLPQQFVVCGSTLVLALLAGSECDGGTGPHNDGRASSVSTDTLPHYLSDGQNGAVALQFLYRQLIPQTGLKLRAHGKCAKTKRLRRKYLETNPSIIFQESLRVPVTIAEREMVRVSPTLRTARHRLQHL